MRGHLRPNSDRLALEVKWSNYNSVLYQYLYLRNDHRDQMTKSLLYSFIIFLIVPPLFRS